MVRRRDASMEGLIPGECLELTPHSSCHSEPCEESARVYDTGSPGFKTLGQVTNNNHSHECTIS